MAISFGTVDGVCHSGQPAGAGTIEGVALAHHALLQGGGQHQGLEGGARLVGLAQPLVPPLGLQDGGVGLGLGLLLELRVGELLLGGLLVVLRLELLIDPLDIGRGLALEQTVHDRRVVVGVKLRGAGHGQDLHGLGIGHDAHAAVAHVVSGDALLQDLLGIGLDGAVDGQGQVIAVDRVHIVGVAVVQLVVLSGAAGDYPAGNPFQDFFVLGLQAVRATLRVDKAQHLGGQRSEGVVPLGAGGEIEVIARFVLLNKGADGLGLFLLQLGEEHLILGVFLGHSPLQIGPVQVGTNGHQAVDDLVPQLLHRRSPGLLVLIALLIGIIALVHAVHQVLGGQNQVVYGGRHGQHIAVGVQNVPPVGGHRHVHQLLICGPLLVKIVVPDGDRPQLDHQRNEQSHPAHQHQKQGAPEYQALGLPVAVDPAVPVLPLPARSILHVGPSLYL